MPRLSYAVLERISRLLLITRVTLFLIAAYSVGSLPFQSAGNTELRGQLLGQRALQAELLANQDSDHALYPHVVEGVSYVLNPAIKTST